MAPFEWPETCRPQHDMDGVNDNRWVSAGLAICEEEHWDKDLGPEASFACRAFPFVGLKTLYHPYPTTCRGNKERSLTLLSPTVGSATCSTSIECCLANLMGFSELSTWRGQLVEKEQSSLFRMSPAQHLPSFFRLSRCKDEHCE